MTRDAVPVCYCIIEGAAKVLYSGVQIKGVTTLVVNWSRLPRKE
jgi:hypothetical protein